MVKKCVPGLICFETMTVGLIFIIIIIISFLAFQYFSKYSGGLPINTNEKIFIVNSSHHQQGFPGIISPLLAPPISTKADPFNDPYYPPLKNDMVYTNRNNNGMMGYTQLGILTRSERNDNLILPLMGRRVRGGSNSKYQYYTISNNGNINTKLPVSSKGKSGMSDYGCDEIYNNDTVYVEGYKDMFLATIYENNSLTYV